jgi:hypothetical protein
LIERDLRGVDLPREANTTLDRSSHRAYKSLSAIARAITGTRWNGWVFFGLKNHRSRT